MTRPSSEEQIKFLSNIQRLLDEGSFVATYKYALLLALADLSVEQGDDSGNPLTLTTQDIAEKFVLYYWRQTRPYAPINPGQDPSILRQNTGRPAKVISLICEASEQGFGSPSSAGARQREKKQLIREVKQTVEVMPLWKLQVMSRDEVPFLYENRGKGHEIVLKEGVAFCFRRFYGLVRNIVQGAWVRFVRNLRGNHALLGEGQDLAEFLFGSQRVPLDVYRPILREVQSGSCFYCAKKLSDNSEVDHFVPWSRYPLDLGHNFVLACRQCNNAKRDLLAAPSHLDHWLHRNDEHGPALSTYFDDKALVHNMENSRLITRWAYGQAATAGADVWLQKGKVVALEDAWQELLGA
jgi:5-methylcytosine-specific restriction endonuclease McrA